MEVFGGESINKKKFKFYSWTPIIYGGLPSYAEGMELKLYSFYRIDDKEEVETEEVPSRSRKRVLSDSDEEELERPGGKWIPSGSPPVQVKRGRGCPRKIRNEVQEETKENGQIPSGEKWILAGPPPADSTG